MADTFGIELKSAHGTSFAVHTCEHGKVFCGDISTDDFKALTKRMGKKAVICTNLVGCMRANNWRGGDVRLVVAYDQKHAEAWEKEISATINASCANKADAWWYGTDTGTSSKAIFRVFNRRSDLWMKPRDLSFPRDPSDFGRCYRLLQIFPEWIPRLAEVAEKLPWWKPFTDRWAEMTALYEEELPSGRAPKLYALMEIAEAEGEAVIVGLEEKQPPR